MQTKDTLNIALLQLTSINDIQKNNQQIQSLMKKMTAPQEIDIISLPENTFFLRTKEGESVKYLSLKDPLWDFYKDFAAQNNVMIHFGATPLEHDQQKWNATVLVMPDGSICTPYQKMHLFDIQLENQKPVHESDIFEKGAKPHTEDFLGWRLGFTICYDIRFSELFMYYQRHEADLIFIPSAFLVETGKSHWEILNRARAIETQAYIVSAAQGGQHCATRRTYGHSMVVDPWGQIIAEIKDDTQPGLLVAKLDKSVIKKVREQIPMKNHRRMKVEF